MAYVDGRPGLKMMSNENEKLILTISCRDPCCVMAVTNWGCSRRTWWRASSLGAKCLAAARIHTGERSLLTPMDA